MRKLRLRIDDLEVESFRTAPVESLRGTVRAFDDSTDCSYGSPMYTGCDLTCAFPCDGSGDCTPTCPRTSGGGGGTAWATCYPDSGCDLSCEFG